MAITGKGTSQDYGYTGGMQSFTAPFTGLYLFQLWGASGGKSYNGNGGGAGGYVYGYRVMTAGQTLYLAVGGAGRNGVASTTSNIGGSFNGGGTSGPNYNSGATATGGSGGGATSLSTANTTIAGNVGACLLIAGGGGGGGWGGSGGGGGGVSGLNGLLGSSHSGQTAPTPTNYGYWYTFDATVYFEGYISSSVGQGISTGVTTLGYAAKPGGSIHTWGGYFGNAGGGGGGRFGGSSGVQASGSGGSGYTGGMPAVTFNGRSYGSGYGGSNSGNGRATVTLVDVSSNLYYDGTQALAVNFDGTNVTKVIMDGTTVYG